jgi:hypothetical protein
MTKHRNDAVPRGRSELERLEIGDTSVDFDVAISRKSPCFHDPHRAQVDRHDVVPELCEEDPVAALAVAQAQSSRDWKSRCNLAQEIICLGSECETLFGVSFVPTLAARSGA